MYDKKELGSLITRLREEKGIPSQKALADIADVAQSTVREIELGKSSPNMETLAKICDVFDLTVLEFFFMLQGPEDSLLIDKKTKKCCKQ
ncbi:MAG TPA: helix-turn-helix transcriptional regulator [Gelria sp.]|jgi:DNA-binding XRE family transcriptional regulator|nr:helix-turn-helix transcriptional regulator [Gelria sp.]